jgi:toxin ParE1/3/4
MNRSVRIRPAASNDIDNFAEYIARDSLRMGLEFLDAVQASLEFVATSPEIGEACLFRDRAIAELRMWPVRGFKKHIIIYRPSPTGIEVVRLIHAAQDFRAIFGD